MKTYKTQFLTILAALIAAGITAQAQYTYTTLDDPSGHHMAQGISGTNIVGYYLGHQRQHFHGFLYNGSTWTMLDDPLADSGFAIGTEALGISGTNIVGFYQDINGISHGFLHNGILKSNWTTLDDPSGRIRLRARDRSVRHFRHQHRGDITYASNGGDHGFLYNWQQLDHVGRSAGTGGGTYLGGIDGTNVVGGYWNASGINHGFLYNGRRGRLERSARRGRGTFAWRISGTNIVGLYWDSSGNVHGFLYNSRATGPR